LRHHRTGTLIEFSLREVGNRMGHLQEFVVWHTPGLCHGPASCFKYIGDDRSGGNTMFFKQNAVEHTARAARASITNASDDDIAVGGKFLDDFLMRWHA
jgi:hypothetical protein